jgi:hypothetical protein
LILAVFKVSFGVLNTNFKLVSFCYVICCITGVGYSKLFHNNSHSSFEFTHHVFHALVESSTRILTSCTTRITLDIGHLIVIVNYRSHLTSSARCQHRTPDCRKCANAAYDIRWPSTAGDHLCACEHCLSSSALTESDFPAICEPAYVESLSWHVSEVFRWIGEETKIKIEHLLH